MLVVNSVKKNKSKKRKLAVLNIKVKVRESSISNVSLKLKKKKISKVYTFKMSKEASVPTKKNRKRIFVCILYLFLNNR